MYYFCTYFDQHYLHRGLALYMSLRRHCPSFKLWVLCMDDPCYDILVHLNLPDLNVIALRDFESDDRDLSRAKDNRARIEYYFTCTPSLLLFIFKNFVEVDMLSYLDADLFFFDNPASIYEEIADHSIAIIEHRFSLKLRSREKYGVYNVGYLFFMRDENAFACLNWWRKKCIEWCYDMVEDGRYADQKYLDDWPTRFQGVTVLQNKGANLAPWNIANYKISNNDNNVLVDNQPLIFFHFHGLKKINNWLYDPNLSGYKLRLSYIIKHNIYEPYIDALSSVTRKYEAFFMKASKDRSIRYQLKKTDILKRIWKTVDKLIYFFKIIVTGNFILVKRGRVL